MKTKTMHGVKVHLDIGLRIDDLRSHIYGFVSRQLGFEG